MNVTEAMERIESSRFSATVNVASNLKTFLRAVAAQPEAQALAEALSSAETAFQVAERVGQLAALPGEEGHEHPADAALAAYLWLLNHRHSEAAQTAAAAVRGCEGLWWARQVVESVAPRGTAAPPAGTVQESSRNGGPTEFAESEARRPGQ